MALLGSTSLTGCNSIPDFIAAGSLMLFEQTAAPTSWTKQTTHNNKALRVITGTAAPGGNTAFTTVFASRTPTGSVSVSGSNSGGSVGETTLTTTQMPAHRHQAGSHSPAPGGSNVQLIIQSLITGPTVLTVDSETAPGPAKIQPAGGNGSHVHPFSVPTWSGSASFTGTALDFAVQYVDLIIASKN
jgi:hypothetical protein